MKCFCHHAYELDSPSEDKPKQAELDARLEQLKLEVSQAEYDLKALPLKAKAFDRLTELAGLPSGLGAGDVLFHAGEIVKQIGERPQVNEVTQ